ncbi:C40 family peptidase [Flammeovirga agarivorans]|uniref:C40 family peptidase n=1 Tax=Flammeovirga agarivorans TaxID=2726742 RepID=A0A7X8SI95_9BACT|nr:C40 family peptidase [Flammeovirga agarivorans]NLR90759.1 C40 family peptidase [Flammeovirga agarivorans]
MKKLLLLFIGIITIHSLHAQSIEKLRKTLNKGKYEKVMHLGMKAQQKYPDAAYPFLYMSWAAWFEGQGQLNYAKTQWRYINTSLKNYELYCQKIDDPQKKDRVLTNKLRQYLEEFYDKSITFDRPDEANLANNWSIKLFDEPLNIKEEASPILTAEVEEISPFSFSFSEGIYETFFKAEDIKTSPEKIAKKADDYIGVPYKYAKEDPYDGFDCSGFVLYVYKQFGFEFPHNSKRIAMLGKSIPLGQVQEGDIVCFGAENANNYKDVYHIGIIYRIEKEDVKMIHCGTSTGVVVADLNKGYWNEQSFFIKRLMTLEHDIFIK